MVTYRSNKCPSLHQRKQTLAASTNRRRRLSEWEIVAAVRRTQELPSSCSRASRRILRVVCLHLASLLCARLLAPPSASECSSCARWLLLVVRGCLCSILPPSVTGVSSQSLASRGSPVSSPAAEATRGVVSCFVAFRGVVAHSPSDVDSVLASNFKWELGAGEDNNIFLELIQTKVVSAASCTSSTLFSALRYLKKRKNLLGPWKDLLQTLDFMAIQHLVLLHRDGIGRFSPTHTSTTVLLSLDWIQKIKVRPWDWKLSQKQYLKIVGKVATIACPCKSRYKD
ncbi:hypothetical protein AAHE18_13G041300 [Arachis hypogaea]